MKNLAFLQKEGVLFYLFIFLGVSGDKIQDLTQARQVQLND